MKLFKIVSIAVAVLATFAIGLSPALADSPGQLTGGSQVYQVKNITQGGGYANSISASCNDVIQYSSMLHNAAYGGLTNVIVSANLANGTLSAVPAEGASAGTNGSVIVNLSSGSLVYQNGTTTLYNSSGAVIRTLPDTITSGGVNIGAIDGSTTEFVNFQAKVSCPPVVTPVTTPAATPAKAVVATGAKALPNTGPGEVAGLFVGTSALGSAGHYLVSRRRK